MVYPNMFFCSSLAMEARNDVFKNTILSLQEAYPNHDETKLAQDVINRMPSHFDAFGAKRSTNSTEDPPSRIMLSERDLDKACQGFPLHLPGHVEPCRDNAKIRCNWKDRRIRRLVNVRHVN